jgi:membrane protein
MHGGILRYPARLCARQWWAMSDQQPEQSELARVLEEPAPASRFDRARQHALDQVAAWTERIPVIGAIVEAGQRERATGGGLLAGGVAYRLFFWVVPVGLMLAAAGSLAGIEPKESLQSAAGSRGVTSVAATATRQAMDANAGNRWYLLGLGVALSVWFGIGVVRALNIAFALAWNQPIRRLRHPIAAGIVFTVLAMALSAGANAIKLLVSSIGLGPVALSLAIVLVYAGAAFVITVLFPHGDAPPRALVPGCLLLSVGGLLVHAFVNVYLAPRLGRSIDLYGLLGAASVVLLWLYVIARLITVSAFLNASLWRDAQR